MIYSYADHRLVFHSDDERDEFLRQTRELQQQIFQTPRRAFAALAKTFPTLSLEYASIIFRINHRQGLTERHDQFLQVIPTWRVEMVSSTVVRPFEI